MNTVAKLYWTVFLRSGLIYGLVLGIWGYLEEAEVDFLKLGFMTVAFGVLMSWTTVTAQKRAMRTQGKNFTDEDIKASQHALVAKRKSKGREKTA